MLVGAALLLTAAPAFNDDDRSPIQYPALPAVAAKPEDFVSPGWVMVSKAQGDLNRDSRPDIALALWTEKASKATSFEEISLTPPYRLVIAFAEPKGGYRLAADSKELLEPPASSGAYEDALGPDGLIINRGSLDIYRDLLRGHYRYRFRWTGTGFGLIGYEYGASDGACISERSVNFLTRQAIIKVMPIDEEWHAKVVRRVKRGPLPTFDTVSSTEFWANGMGIIGDEPDCPRPGS